MPFLDMRPIGRARQGGLSLQATVDAVWKDILRDIAAEIGETRFNLWFRTAVPVGLEPSSGGASLVVGVPSAFMAEWLETHYLRSISEAATARMGAPTTVRFVVDGKLFRGMRRDEARAKDDLLEEIAPSGPARGAREGKFYNLESFVVGPCNSVAYAAAAKVIESPSDAYNPLFLHGGVGLGKTHLLMAIANAMKGRRSFGNVEYTSAEGFTNRFLFALRNGSLDAFRARYRRARLLVIDDIHFLANKNATQDEFLNTFNTLSRDGCQIVMASDSHPKMIGRLKDTLVTRFLSGMVARLDKPDYQTRLAIISHKAVQNGLSLRPEVAEFAARQICGSVRELEGAVSTLVAYAALSKAPVDLAIAREALKGLVEASSRPVMLPDIEAAVTAMSGLSAGDIRSGRRSRPVSAARHLAMYLARGMGGFSYAEIGLYFGGRNHSSVVAAVAKIENQVAADADFARKVASLKSEFSL